MAAIPHLIKLYGVMDGFDKTMPDMKRTKPIHSLFNSKPVWWIETLQAGGVRQRQQ
jgi:hypothetical protein